MTPFRFFQYFIASVVGALVGGFGGWHVLYAVTRYPTENTDGDWAALGALIYGIPIGALIGIFLGIALVRLWPKRQ